MKTLRALSFIFCISTLFFASCKAPSKTPSDNRPNILIIMADDLGFSDIGCYGSDIDTPSIDSLAKNGLRFTQFYNASRCCPTRASLLTGCYPHKVGMRFNRRSLSDKVKTIAELLKADGYQTGMTGKWHLSETKGRRSREQQLKWLSHRADYGPFGPLASYPSNRGFDEHYGVIWGVVNYFDPFSLVHNEKPIKEVPDDFYITDFISAKAVDLIDSFSKNDKPFFLYVAHCAPHWPLHAKVEDIKKYKDKYLEGWAALQKKRYQGAIKKGVIDKSITTLPSLSGNKTWGSLSDDEKEYEANIMAIHAAMIDCMDQGIGDIINKLKSTGEFENTVIFFLADNGASPERGYRPGFDRNGHKRDGQSVNFDATTNLGSEDSYPYLGQNWASACNAPFRYWKKESYEGGNHSPLIIHWPQGFKAKQGSLTSRLSHVTDIFPSILEVAKSHQTQSIAIDGLSLFKEGHKVLYFEHIGGRAMRTPHWKIAALSKEPWKLFNISQDASETRDLSKKTSQNFQVNEI